MEQHNIGYPVDPLWERFGNVPQGQNEFGMAIDSRHLRLMLAMLDHFKPRKAMEIGSFNGCSTTAFLDHMDRNPDMELHIVEINPRPGLVKLISESPHAKRITLHPKPSWENMFPVDFLFIDGDHGWPALADALQAISCGVPVITMHDHNCFHHRVCWGSVLLGDILSNSLTRAWYEDTKKRPGEMTDRGFSASLAEPSEAVRLLFERV